MSTRLKASWRGIVAAAMIAIAALVAMTVFSGWDASAGSSAREAAEERAQDTAEIYCNIDGVVPGMTGIDDPAYLECVRQRAKKEMEKWDARH